MAIPCPGAKDVDQDFNIDVVGATALAAVVEALSDLKGLIERITKCEEGCIRTMGEPKWTLREFKLTQEANGTWACRLWGGYEVRVECKLPVEGPIEVDYEQEQAKS